MNGFAVFVKFHDSVSFRVRNFFGENMAAGAKIFDSPGKIIFKDIVSKNHCHVVIVYERFSENKSVGESSRDALHFEIKADFMPFKNPTQEGSENARMLLAR